MGRKTDFTQEIGDDICERIASGESLRSICLGEGSPARSTVFRWLSLDKTFSDQYAKAREAQADTLFDEILDIADNSANDYMVRAGEECASLNSEAIQRARLRIDARKWMAGKMRPKKYGDHVNLNHSGGLTITLESDADKL